MKYNGVGEVSRELRGGAHPRSPRDSYALVKKGSAIGEMLRAEFQEKYPVPALIPPELRPRYAMLAAANAQAFRDAEALGWQPGK